MERSEPSLVPEWLKGASSGVGGAIHHTQTSANHPDESFSSRQRVQPHGLATGGSHVEYESPRLTPSSSDRAYYSAVRRGPGGGSTSVNDRLIQDREAYSQHSRGYTNFGRSPAYRSYDVGVDRSDRDASRDRDWDWDRERDRRDRDRVLGAVEDRDRDRDRVDRTDSSSTFRRPGLGLNAGTRYEPEIPAPLRRVQSMGSAARALENGEKKTGDLGGLPTAPPSNSGSLSSSMQKAAFERNFPSLGAQERVMAVSSVQSNLGNVGVLSPRPLWQGSATPRLDGSRSTASSPGLPTGGNTSNGLTPTSGGSGGEGWSSALAGAPSALTGGNISSLSGTLVAPVTSSIASVSSAASLTHTTISVTGSPMNPPKMVEALVQNPPRVRTPPQHLADTQRLEELILKQTRQLIPIVHKTNTPKTMIADSTPWDKPKPKPKVVRTVDVVGPASAMKMRQPLVASQVSPFRPPAPPRVDPSKPVQSAGKTLVRKININKEGVPGLSSSQGSSGLKPDSPPLVTTAGGLGLSMGNTGTIGVLNTLPAPRKQKQLLDRRAVPISPISVSAGLDGNAGGMRSKDVYSGTVTGSDERRPSAPRQNRGDFFEALRRKSGLGSSPIIVDKEDVAPPKNSDLVNGKEVTNSHLEVQLPEDGGGIALVESHQLENGDCQQIDATADSDVPGACNELFVEGREKKNGLIVEDTSDELFETTVGTLPQKVASGGATVDEEEEAFLRSLGWEDSAEGGEELTQEEINSFYQRRNEWTTAVPATRNLSNNHHHKRMDLRVGSIGSETSGVTTSDSESDDDRQVRGSR